MKNKLFLMIMVVMVCSLTACGQQENGSMTNTETVQSRSLRAKIIVSWQQQKIIIWSKQRRRNKINYRM